MVIFVIVSGRQIFSEFMRSTFELGQSENVACAFLSLLSRCLTESDYADTGRPRRIPRIQSKLIDCFPSGDSPSRSHSNRYAIML